MIDFIELKNFKCYKEQKFEFRPLTVFCGGNSVGKSTAIHGLLMALQSGFDSEIFFNGDLVSLGSYKDVHCRFAVEDESVSVSVGLDEGTPLSWGHKPEQLADDSERAREYLPILGRSKKATLEGMAKKYGENFQFLTAERWGPRNNHPYTHTPRHSSWLGIFGEFSPQVIDSINKAQPKHSESDPRIHVGLRSKAIGGGAYATSAEDKVSIHLNIQEWLHEICPGVYIRTETHPKANISISSYEIGGSGDMSSAGVRPVNVGFGLSYSISIIVALLNAKKGGLVIVENPEAHLHPRGQSYLGRLLALTAMAGVQVIVETHSEHIINGMRIIIKSQKDYPENAAKVIFVENGGENQQPIVHDLVFGKDAHLPEWPRGFFDQQGIDVRLLMKGEA